MLINLSEFVPPGTFKGEPEVTMIKSPELSISEPRSSFLISSRTWSRLSAKNGYEKGRTPRNSETRRCVILFLVNAYMGISDLVLDNIRAVDPDSVKATIALISIFLAILIELSAIASSIF